MKILIIGGQFHNKGAFLMVMTVVKKLKELIKDCEIVLSNYLEVPDGLKNEEVKLLKKPLLHVGYDYKQFKRYLKYSTLVNIYKGYPKGEISLKEIDVIIDIAGFAYGDLWGTNPLINLNYLLNEVFDKKVKYIVLPQAFGPFEKKGMALEITKMLKNANLVYARDRKSKSYLEAIGGNNKEKIRQAPDITLSFKEKVVTDSATEKYCCIVPNERMLDKGDVAWQDTYSDVLKSIIKSIQMPDLKVFLMVHDTTSGDGKIAKTLHEKVDADHCELLEIADPLEIKKIIANSQFLIGSRFHSLASALSCNVPALAMGWSHKYQMLFEEYEMDEYVFDKPDETKIIEKANSLTDPETNQNIRKTLKEKNEEIISKTEMMWGEVQAVIG